MIEQVLSENAVILGIILIVVGAAGALIRKNVLVVLMCIELMLNGVILMVLSYSIYLDKDNVTGLVKSISLSLDGQIIVLFIMAVAAAEAAVGLALIVALYRTVSSIESDDMNLLKW